MSDYTLNRLHRFTIALQPLFKQEAELQRLIALQGAAQGHWSGVQESDDIWPIRNIRSSIPWSDVQLATYDELHYRLRQVSREALRVFKQIRL